MVFIIHKLGQINCTCNLDNCLLARTLCTIYFVQRTEGKHRQTHEAQSTTGSHTKNIISLHMIDLDPGFLIIMGQQRHTNLFKLIASVNWTNVLLANVG